VCSGTVVVLCLLQNQGVLEKHASALQVRDTGNLLFGSHLIRSYIHKKSCCFVLILRLVFHLCIFLTMQDWMVK
jgi:hypothetical protein